MVIRQGGGTFQRSTANTSISIASKNTTVNAFADWSRTRTTHGAFLDTATGCSSGRSCVGFFFQFFLNVLQFFLAASGSS